MKGIISTEMRDKMKLSREKNNGLILNTRGIKITADPLQYLLNMSGYQTTFHTSLASLFEEVYSRKEKQHLIENKDKSIGGILDTIEKTQKWLKGLLKPLGSIKIED